MSSGCCNALYFKMPLSVGLHCAGKVSVPPCTQQVPAVGAVCYHAEQSADIKQNEVRSPAGKKPPYTLAVLDRLLDVSDEC
jgi:hypothetical protein